MQSRKYLGHWWVEEFPNRQLPGSLSYHPTEGIQLQVMNDFVTTFPTSKEPAERFDKILGFTEEGTWITLIDCPRDKSSISNVGRTSSYMPRFLIEGFPFQNKKPALDDMTISFYGMDSWGGLANPQPGDNILENPDDFKKRPSIVVDIPDPLDVWNDRVRIRLGINTNLNLEKFQSGTLTLKHQFIISPRRTQVPFTHYLPHINKLNNFVSMGLGHPTDPRYIQGKVRTPNGEYKEVDVFFPIQGDLNSDISVHPLRMPFRASEIADDFSQILKLWYICSEEIGEIYDLYFATVFNSKMYPENQFLSLCHGLESYHRKRFDDTYMDSSDFEDIYKDLIDLLSGDPANVYSNLDNSADNLRNRHSIPGPFVQSLKTGTLKYANTKSLRRRLKEIISNVEYLVGDLPYSIVGKEKKVADTRNYFAHRTDELKKKAAHQPERTKLIWGLEQLIEACLLLEIGIPEALIQERLKNRYRNRWVG
jgi:hypothetical protein